MASVLVHGNEPGLRHVLHCLAAQERRPDAVVVVDNGNQLPAQLPAVDGLALHLVRAEQNLGVGGGHNLGVRSALDELAADWVWMLEHDTFPDPGCLLALERRAARHPKGIVVPDVTRNNYERRWLQPDHDGETMTKCTFNGPLVAREVIELVGPFNEAYFVGQEDWEFSQRSVAAGVMITRCCSAIVVHANKGDGRFGGYVSPARLYYSARNLVAANPPSGLVAEVHLAATTVARCAAELVRRGRGRRHAAARWFAWRDGRRGRMGRRQHRFMREG